MTNAKNIQNCRLLLTFDLRRSLSGADFNALLQALEATSVILYDPEGDEVFLQKQAEQLVPLIQAQNAAALIADDSRIAHRVKADGIHISQSLMTLRDMMERHSPEMIIGMGGLKDRHSAMEAGELSPDYLMFGKLGADKKPEAHPRNLALAAWWADVMEIPAIIQAGSSLESIEKAASTKAEFIAAEDVFFHHGDMLQTAETVRNLLKQYVFEDGDFS